MSDLARKLAEAVVTEDECLRGQIASFLGSFQVNDLLCDKQNLKVVLLCESPHTDEVCKQYPLAGHSGKIVASVLMKDVLCTSTSDVQSQAIGELVKDRNSCFKWLGIMNVSSLPLQLKPYYRESDSYALNNIYPLIQILGNFGYIRETPKAAANAENNNDYPCIRVIMNDLRTRLSGLHGQNPGITYVPCGDVARYFFCKACPDEIGADKTVSVPHPSSRKPWRKKDGKLRPEIKCMRKKINCAIPKSGHTQ